ncbi:lytic transglycosylase domain-containing protein, partial [Methylobacterium sp. WL18]
MGVFPEPARCADDVSRLVPKTSDRTSRFEDETVAWLPRQQDGTKHRALRRMGRNGLRRFTGTLALGFVSGFGLPQAAFAPAFFAPAAQAHDRIDISPRTAQALAADGRTGWLR